ncbi:MAG: MFS transporter [Candidatus Lokiarchaeota archaeon]|nr:MFS transporter [Candidatus Harpocratesius repetitus]
METARLTNGYTRISKSKTIAFGLGPLADQMSHQMFTFLVFTFYYAVVQININHLMIGFIVFAIWDSINDPLLGPISDRTQSRFGRRGFWILLSTIPFGISNVVLFTVGVHWSYWVKFAYMLFIIMIYDAIYTIFSCNQLALFSDMFETEEERGYANLWKSVLTIVGVIIGFVLPTIFIKPMTPQTGETEELISITDSYILTGIVVGILTIIAGLTFFRWGMQENIHHQPSESEDSPSFFQMIRDILSNRDFMMFTIANLVKWFVFKLLTTIVPLYAIFVLGIAEGGILVSAILLVAFLSATAAFPLMKSIGLRFGWRNGFIISSIFWIFALIPFWFLENQPYWAIFCMIFLGVGLSGAMYFVEPIIGNIVDEDELQSGQRRTGTFYGINGLINRYSTILVFVVIAVVLTGYGWEDFLVKPTLEQQQNMIFGLKLLMTPISMVGLLLVIVFLSLYGLHGEKLRNVQEQLKLKRKIELRNSE